eukprot:TRINITY_DN4492_c0_g1_i1.p1 TRINITY_DN4492_c0_g1~~TRINITY_DN4492_c0_g1_i1.p1  ORF type:complete len:374 (+),score=83.11 TRINITY_DN4492_c0_g1_i1:128-1249(+)
MIGRVVGARSGLRAALSTTSNKGSSGSEAYVWGRGKVKTVFGSTNKDGALGIGSSVKELLIPKKVTIQGEEISRVSLGHMHSAFVTASGKLFVTGNNEAGQLGVELPSDSKDRTLSPVQVLDLPSDIVEVGCGGFHTAAVTSNGDVYTWGWGGNVWNWTTGALGHGDRASHKRPKKVEALQGVKIVKIACGKEHMLALSDSGELYVWGSGEHGRLGNGSSGACLVPDLLSSEYFLGDKISHVAAGHFHSVVLTASGKVYTWGRNNEGQLGVGGNFDLFSVLSSPQRVNFSEVEDTPDDADQVTITAIATSEKHVLAVTQEGGLFIWGDAQWSAPKNLSESLNTRKIVRVAAGNHFSLAVDGEFFFLPFCFMVT